MGEIINLLDYKKTKEEREIELLQAELRSLISDLGGIHVVPTMILRDTPDAELMMTQDPFYLEDDGLGEYATPSCTCYTVASHEHEGKKEDE